MLEVRPIDVLTRPSKGGIPVALEESPDAGRIASLMAAASSLMSCADADSLLRVATELARSDIGLERASLFMVEQNAARMLLRGTWGTGVQRETTDEHEAFHELSGGDYRVLRSLPLSGGVTVYRSEAPLFAIERGRERIIGRGWFACTPLVVGRDVVGVLYNDAAISGRPLDEGTQALAGLFCSLVATVYDSRRGPWFRRTAPSSRVQSALIERALSALSRDPRISGERLAVDLGVTQSHLARRFKREMEMTFVEYRARLRLDRFFELTTGRPNRADLQDLAREAGFGSYSQFHRVHTKLVGESPRAHRRRSRCG